jgi:eukaryotic-like serine/threonine-protein kinase
MLGAGNRFSSPVLTLKVVPHAGDTIADRYVLERPIAEGGMGSVWRAQHRTLGRSFAIKFLKTTIQGAETLEQRFLREARMAASIQHRFVVDIVDFGVTPDAVPYMVMEFLQGESLDRRCRRLPPLSVVELLRIASDVLLGLEAVHQAGVVHRDLKPENIMLVREADGIIPKLVDFGISSAEVERAHGRRRLTNPGAFVGTPWYMSPEQVGRQEADRRSDIYSVGVIVYEALLGEAPFDHPELMQLLQLVRAGGATPLVVHRPELGEPLSAAVARAMATDPAQRFESAAQMAAHLQELAAQLPDTVMCVAPPSITRTDTEVLRRPAGLPRTRELGSQDEDLTQPKRRAWPTKRLVAAAGALLGIALLTWDATPGPNQPARAPAASALQASTTAASPEIARRNQEVPGTRAPAARRDEPTFTAASAAPGTAAPESEKRATPRRSRGPDGRVHGRIAVPEVFRTPGF